MNFPAILFCNLKKFHIISPTVAGGGEIFTLYQLWETCYPYLDQVGTALGVASTILGFGKWLMKKFRGSYSPCSLVEYIMKKENWAIYDLANDLNMNLDEAKYLLKALGYSWERKSQLYCITDRSKEILIHLKVTEKNQYVNN